MRSRLIILSRNAGLYSTNRLELAARARGINVRVVDYLRCTLVVGADGPQVHYMGAPIFADIVLPRIGASQTLFGTAVVRHFELAGTRSLNPALGISRSRDKITAMQHMAAHGIMMPWSAAGGSQKDNAPLIAGVGGAPVVVKLIEGTHGAGVVLADTDSTADAVISAMRAAGGQVLVQQFLEDAKGADIRAFVVADRVVGAMMRQASDGEFRANLHLGGSARRVKLSDEERDLAVRAAQAFGLGVAGVDLLRTNRGPVVLEINSSPGLEGIEQTTGIDIADRIMEFVEHGTLDRYTATQDDPPTAD